MPQNLSDMTIDEISLVDDPANEQARVLIVKAKKPMTSAKPDAEDEDEDDAAATGAAKEMASLKKAVEDMNERIAALTLAGGNPDDEAAGGLAAASLKELHMDIETLSKALEDAEAKLDTLSKRADDAEAALEEANEVIKAKDAEIETLTKSNGGEGEDDDEIVKSLPESIRKRIADAEAVAQAAQAEITKMREQTETAEAIAKAKALNVGDAEVVGPLLLRVSKGMTTAEDAAALETLLKGLGAQSNTSALFKSFGSDAAVDGDPEEMLKAKATEIQKANEGMSYAVAYAKALEENPSLYNAYVAKRR